MNKCCLTILLFCLTQNLCLAQRTPASIADSVLLLIGSGDEFLPREQLSGKVKSYEISGKLATEADYIAQLLLVHLWGLGKLPEVNSEPKIPGTYQPLAKVAFGPDGAVTDATVLFNGAIRKLPQREAGIPNRQDYFTYKNAGDTIIASSKDGGKMPWVILRFLKNGQLLNAKMRVESDVIFYEEYLFATAAPHKHIIDHYTQAVVYNDQYEATYVPDTPGVTWRNKYKPDAPDTHALRRRSLEGRIVIQQTPEGYTRQYFKGEDLEDPSATTQVNTHGLITETTVKYYSRVLIQLAYEYDQQGNWIKCLPTFPNEREMNKISPILRKITYP